MKDIIQADVPKDLSKIKTKVFFNLTKRQLLCFSGGALLGVPLYFLTRNALTKSVALLLMMLVMMPFFLLAMYEKNGQPLEVIVRHVIEARFQRAKRRPYQTQNLYAALEKQAALNKEVKAIVQPVQAQKTPTGKKGTAKKADPGGKKAAERPSGQGAEKR